MTGPTRSWRPILRRLARLRLRADERRVQVAVVAIVVTALGVTLLAQPPGPAAPVSPPTSPSARPAGSASPVPEGDWQAVELAPVPVVATLAASVADESGVAPNATFHLTSLTAEPAAALAGRLQVTPAMEFAARPAATGDGAVLTPSSSLTEGAVYRFALRQPDGTLAGSWAFQVRSPVRVLTTLPGDRTTSVPTRTGIEVTFDQDGVADMRDHFSIAPTVDGRFERHGRTQVFVPDTLLPGTVYTVTIAAGLARSGTDLILESDVVVRFETTGQPDTSAWLRVGREVVESGPADPPILAVEVVRPDPEGGTPPDLLSAEVSVYRLPSLAAASSTLSAFLAAPRWTEHSPPMMPTDGLPVGTRFTAALEGVADSPYQVLRFPAPLAEGWYVVEVEGGRRSQAFLQVTPVSAWVSVLTDRTVVWANDVVTQGPIAGAAVSIVGGAALGRTDASGLLDAPTPDALVPPAEAGGRDVPDEAPLVSVSSPTGDVVLVPFGVGWDGGIYRGEWWEESTAADSTFWSLLYTERTLYRTTDRIDVWGYLRGRDDDAVPGEVVIRLVAEGSLGNDGSPAVVRATARPDARGAFLATLAFDRLPIGAYWIEAVVEGRIVATRWLEVGIIRKPVFELAISPDHTAVVAGSTVRWATTATFFDGAPVPSLRLAVAGVGDELPAGPTNGLGRAATDLVAPTETWSEGPSDWYVSVRPAGPEEAEIYASDRVLVFPSANHLEASGTVDGGVLRVAGTLVAVDLAAVEADLADGSWTGTPDGRAVAGATIQAVVTELVPIRRQVGTDYDFIDKVVRPRYEWHTERRAVDTVSVTTDGRGDLAVDLAVPDPEHQYEVVLSTPDSAGRVARRTITAGRSVDTWWFDAGVRFQLAGGEDAGSAPYAIGDPIRWRMTDDGEPVPSGAANRFLYVVAQRGLVSARVTDAPTFEREFAAADAPGVFIMGVRFTGTTYPPKAAAWASFDTAARRLEVTVTADRARYRPGEDATLTVRTTDAAGRPIPASVVLQGVDEKLYAIGRAEIPQPLDDLHARVDSGIVRLTSTHQVPSLAGPEGEGGDTTGGGARSDFRDTVAFVALETNRDGTATTTIRLSDDLTSWHILAGAVTADLRAGAGELLVPVGLPLFADVTVADEYLVTDRPAIRLRAFGEAVRPGDRVEFTISSQTLGLAPTTVVGEALTEAWFPLPALSIGRHDVEVAVVAPGRTGADGRPLADRLIRRFDVIRSRLTAAAVSYGLAGDPLPAVAGDEAASYTFTDAERGRYLPILTGLAESGGARLDRGLAQAIAHDLLVDAFDRDPVSLAAVAFDPTRYPVGFFGDGSPGSQQVGLALLPYGGGDPWLAARVAIVAPERVNADALREVTSYLAADGTTLRDLRIAGLAGMAALGAPVLVDLGSALDAPDLTVLERIYLGLGFQALGDGESARAIERSLLADHGQRLGSLVRLATGPTSNDTVDATALFALLAAGVGDPLAADLIAYVADQPSTDASHALELAGAIGLALDRTPASEAAFAWTVDGRRTVVRLAAGDAVTLSLTAAQRSSLAIERVSGRVAMVVSARVPIGSADLPSNPDLGLSRTIPSGPIPADDLIVVDLVATFAGGAVKNGCYEVVEVVPSGLAPIETSSARDLGSMIGPSSIVGQRVTFCAPFGVPGSGPAARMRYVARVVNAGTFTWQPAVMQLPGASDVGAATGPGIVRIGD